MIQSQKRSIFSPLLPVVDRNHYFFSLLEVTSLFVQTCADAMACMIYCKPCQIPVHDGAGVFVHNAGACSAPLMDGTKESKETHHMMKAPQ